MKRLICIILAIITCLGLVACTAEEINTSTGKEGLVSLYKATNKDSFFAYIKKLDTSEYEILDITISQNGAMYAVTTRVKNKWKETENTESFNVLVFEDYYIFSADVADDYLNFLECFNSEKYEILDISAIPGNSDFFVVYRER